MSQAKKCKKKKEFGRAPLPCVCQGMFLSPIHFYSKDDVGLSPARVFPSHLCRFLLSILGWQKKEENMISGASLRSCARLLSFRMGHAWLGGLRGTEAVGMEPGFAGPPAGTCGPCPWGTGVWESRRGFNPGVGTEERVRCRACALGVRQQVVEQKRCARMGKLSLRLRIC